MSARSPVVLYLLLVSLGALRVNGQGLPWCKPVPAEPLWSDIVEADRPDYVNVSSNFKVQQSLRMVISGLEKAIEQLENGGGSVVQPEADGVCLCNCQKDAAYWKDFVATTLATEAQNALQKTTDQHIADVQAEMDKAKAVLFDAIPKFKEDVHGIIEDTCTKLLVCEASGLKPVGDALYDEAAETVKAEMDGIFGPHLKLEKLEELRDRAKKLYEAANALLDKISGSGPQQASALITKENQDEVRRIFNEAKSLYTDIAAALKDLDALVKKDPSQWLKDVGDALHRKLGELVKEDGDVFEAMKQRLHEKLQERIDAIKTAAEALYDTATDGQKVLDEFAEELQAGLLNSLDEVEGCYGITKKRECTTALFCNGTTEANLFGNEDLALPLWFPTEIFKDGQTALRWALDLIKWMEFLKKNFDRTAVTADMKKVLEELKNLDEVITKISALANTYTDGFHLGAYSDVRPDLHACVGYAGHGVLAEVFSTSSGNFRGGADYLSANLSRKHRSQLRAGGFALFINGRHLPLAPGVSLNLQMDGFRLWDRHHPFGIGAGKSEGWEVEPGDFKKLDYFNLVDEQDLEKICCEPGEDKDCIICPITASSLIHKGFYEVKYTSGGVSREWPRTEVDKNARIAAVFGAGLNLDLKMKTRYWSTTPIPVFPGATIMPWLSLDAGVHWVYAANKFRDTLREQISKGLPEGKKLTEKDFGRDMHAFQADDVTEDVGNGATVNPKLGADLNVGIALSRWFTIGVTANLYVGVDVDASGTGGVLDLNRALVDTLRESNPKGDDCKPIIEKNELRACSNEAFKKTLPCPEMSAEERKTNCSDQSAPAPEGTLFSTGTYTCSGDDLLCGEAKGYCTDRSGKILMHDVTREQCEGPEGARFGCVAVYRDNPNGLGHPRVWGRVEEELSMVGPPYGIGTEKGLRDGEMVKAQQAAATFRDEASCTSSGWCYNWGYRPDIVPDVEGRYFFYVGVFTGISGSQSTCPVPVDRKGRAILGQDGKPMPSQFIPFEWQLTDRGTGDRTFFPYQCVTTFRPEVTGYEGPDCSPLEFGYPSACPDGKDCSCDPNAPNCETGKICVDGACLTQCTADTECPDGRTCSGGVCVMSSGVPFAEQVAWRMRNAAVPQHSVASYGLNRLITSVVLGYGVRVGATLRLFKKPKTYNLLDLSDAKPLVAFPSVKHQLGLEAQYQDDCKLTGSVTNHQRSLIKRYPGADGTSSRELLAWCRPEMAADEQNPAGMPSVDEVVADGVNRTFDFGLDLGVDYWNRAQPCIDGQTWDQYFASLQTNPAAAWPRMRCAYKKNGVPVALTCTSAGALQSSLATTLGCLSASGPERLQANAVLLQFLNDRGLAANWLLPPPYVDVLDVTKIFLDDEGLYNRDNLDPAFRQYEEAGLDVSAWLAGLDQCIRDAPFGRLNQDHLDIEFDLDESDLQPCGGVCCVDGTCERVADQSRCEGKFLPVSECTSENDCTLAGSPPPRGACFLFGSCQEVMSAGHCIGGTFLPGKSCTELPDLCERDQDCAAAQWCRPTRDGGNACVPWQEEDGPCGGFIEPSARERCAPGFTCISKDPGHDFGGKCVRVCAPAPLSLAAWWPLDESAGAPAIDVLARNDGRRLNAITSVAGRVRNAAHFDGIDDYVEIADAADLDFGTADFSIAIWMRMPHQSGVQSIIDKRDGRAGYHLYVWFGRPGLQIAGGSYTNYTAARYVADGQWHHVVVTVDRDRRDGIRWYIDGEPAGTADPTNHQSSINSDASLRFGVRTVANDGWWEGDLDEPALFNRSLTADEVISMHRAGSEGLCHCVGERRGLQAWWGFDEDPRYGPHFGDLSNGLQFGQSMNGTRSIRGMAGRALFFDGVDDYAEVPSSARVDVGTGDFSLEGWIGFAHWTGTRVIAGKSAPGAGYELLAVGPKIALRLTSGGRSTTYESGITLADGRWHHVAVTVRRDSADGIRFYLDGRETGRGDATLHSRSLSNTVPFRIAADNVAVIPTTFWRGRIDELTLHARALAAVEIARLFRAGAYGRCTPTRPLAPPPPFIEPIDVPGTGPGPGIPKGRDRTIP